MALPWTNKFLPKKKENVTGQDKAVESLHDFVVNFKSKKKNAALIYGPVGCGKTSAAHAIASEMDLEILEVNASDVRNKDVINRILGGALNQMSLFSKGKIILFDEIDGLSGHKDRGGVPALVKLIKDSKFPIILTANDPWDSKFSSLRSKSEMIQFNTLDYRSVANILKRICEKEGIKFNDGDLKTLARRSAGDARGAINDLQSLTHKDKELKKEHIDQLSDRLKIDSILNALVKIFKTTDPNIAIEAFDNINEDLDECFLWIDENLPVEYKLPKDLADAFDCLSKADVYRGRIRRWQHWRFLVYIKTLLTAGIATSKDEKYKSFVKYKRTKRILKLWIANQKNFRKKAIAEKIARKIHSSKTEVIKDTLPYMKEMFKNNEFREKLTDEFELDKEEVEWLSR